MTPAEPGMSSVTSPGVRAAAVRATRRRPPGMLDGRAGQRARHRHRPALAAGRLAWRGPATARIDEGWSATARSPARRRRGRAPWRPTPGARLDRRVANPDVPNRDTGRCGHVHAVRPGGVLGRTSRYSRRRHAWEDSAPTWRPNRSRARFVPMGSPGWSSASTGGWTSRRHAAAKRYVREGRADVVRPRRPGPRRPRVGTAPVAKRQGSRIRGARTARCQVWRGVRTRRTRGAAHPSMLMPRRGPRTGHSEGTRYASRARPADLAVAQHPAYLAPGHDLEQWPSGRTRTRTLRLASQRGVQALREARGLALGGSTKTENSKRETCSAARIAWSREPLRRRELACHRDQPVAGGPPGVVASTSSARRGRRWTLGSAVTAPAGHWSPSPRGATDSPGPRRQIDRRRIAR